MNKKIIKQIEQLVFDLSKNNSDFDWKTHINLVVKYSKVLSKRLKANEEICILASLLHDISKMKKDFVDHDIKGSIEAEKILLNLGYDNLKTLKVKECILTHSSKKFKPKSVEAKIVASADAISHFYNFDAFCFYVYNTKNLSKEEGKKLILKKYSTAYKKIMPKARYLVKKRYEAIKLILN